MSRGSIATRAIQAAKKQAEQDSQGMNGKLQEKLAEQERQMLEAQEKARKEQEEFMNAMKQKRYG